MKLLKRDLVIFFMLLLHSELALTYEINTHEEMSSAAFNSSVIRTSPNLLANIGLKPLADLQTFPNSQGDPRTIIQLIRDGARFEDDFPRYRHHFYNPLNGQGLNAGLATGYPSPDWALEDATVIANQESSFRDAREALHKALTLSTRPERDQQFGRLFQTLGQIAHHLQDMAQPQHVRNDVHCDSLFCPLAGLPKNPSRYEKYIDARRTQFLPAGATYTSVFPSAAHPDGLTQPRHFWHTLDRKGLADYTNRNFVSAGTNFTGTLGNVQPNRNFPTPPEGTMALTPRQIADADLLGPNQPLRGEIDFIGTFVVDNSGSWRFNPMTSSYSVFDADLAAAGASPTFTLNDFNYRATQSFLIPQAVGYSAGMIDYFFRGKLDLDIDYLPNTTGGQYLIKNLGKENIQGSFALYYDAVDGKRYPLAGDTAELAWQNVTIAANSSSPVLLPPKWPANPKPAKMDEFVLVFKGEMGQEKPADTTAVGAVAAKSKIKLLWEPWRLNLTDNHPWTMRSEGGTVKLLDGKLELFAGIPQPPVGSAAWVTLAGGDGRRSLAAGVHESPS